MTNFDFPPELDEIKARMPVTYVLQAYGQAPQEYKGRDILYLTPWRQDGSPSLACYASEDHGIVDRWSDNARPDSGDLLDLIRMCGRTKPDFKDLMAEARALYKAFTEYTAWVAPVPQGTRGTFDIEAARAEVNEWHLHDEPDRLGEWLHHREDYLSNVKPEWLYENFGVVYVDGKIKAPYGDSGLYKYRGPDEKFMSPSGSAGLWWDTFYGQHLDDGTRPVVLCEGETDVWSGTHAAKNYVFLGLPTGAGTRPEKMKSRLTGRRVLIALDADQAGRDSSTLWANALIKEGNNVELVPMSEGHDLSDVTDIPALLARSRPFERPLPGLMVLAGRYHRTSKEGEPGQELSDFTLEVHQVLTTPDGGMSYEVSINGRDTLHLLPREALTSRNSFRNWAQLERGLSWLGSDNDVAILASMLKSSSIFCPSEMASDVIGMWDGHLVWEQGSLGDHPVRFVPQATEVPFNIKLNDGKANPNLVHAMRELNDHSVTDPILAWAAVAPFRSLLDHFPILNVSGTSGSGKTTTVKAIIPTLTGSHMQTTLSSTTPYAVESIIHSTNAFPVVFDEYRPGARGEALARLEVLARDAYDGQQSAKSMGGNQWNKLALIRTNAPIVIAGEQSITETSHAERMILVALDRPQGGRNKIHTDALRAIEQAPVGVLAHSFMNWVVSTWSGGVSLRELPEYEHLPSRVRYNIQVLDLGWRILNDYLVRHNAMPLENPDWSGVVNTTEEVTATNPTADALQWALGDRFGREAAWVASDGKLVVAVDAFVGIVKRNGVHVLPGWNKRTIEHLLMSDYGAERRDSRVNPHSGQTLRSVMVLDADLIFPDDVD